MGSLEEGPWWSLEQELFAKGAAEQAEKKTWCHGGGEIASGCQNLGTWSRGRSCTATKPQC